MATTLTVEPHVYKKNEKPLMSGEEFYASDIGRAELVKGEIIEMPPPGYMHGFLEVNIITLIKQFVAKNNLGYVLSGEAGVYISRNPDTVRGMDGAFISHERMAQVKSDIYLDVAPELIVEVLSPSDRWSGVMEKLEEYFSIGVLAVWIADTQNEQIYVYQSMTEVQRFTIEAVLDGSKVLPGFEVPVKELFNLPKR